MLGVTIITLALAGAIVGGYLAGIESVEHDVIKYDFLADVSGLYDYDTSPQYIEYDPSSNYTGYYSTNTYSEAMNKYYFAEDEVDYTNNTDDKGKVIPNNYKLDLKPNVGTETTVDLYTLDAEEIDTTIRYVYDIQGQDVKWFAHANTDGGAYILKDAIEALNLPENYNHIRISLGNNVNWDDQPTESLLDLELDLHTILILPYDGPRKVVWLTSPNRDASQIENLTVNVTKPYLSIDIDLITWNVSCYTTSDYTGVAQTLRADAMSICFGESQLTATEYDQLNLDDYVTYTPIEFMPAKYLNPNYGVALKEE